MSSAPKILSISRLGFPWETSDPFLFCVHHNDAYPMGNEQLGPAASLAGRQMGNDFAGVDGWRMYHGHVVPGFPQHPHRGFETVTIARRGYIDHSDSLGATARFGHGDVHWLTAGAGIQHAEMFPLLHKNEPNPVELFQIWLNLPSTNKMVAPYFSMLWNEAIPRVVKKDAKGAVASEVTIIAGPFAEQAPPKPPPDSWANGKDHDVAIWSIRMAAGAKLTLPPSRGKETTRTLYFFAGDKLRVGDQWQTQHAGIRIQSEVPAELEAGAQPVEIVVLQGHPIGERVAQYGPFVMNTENEIRQAFADYRATQFGGWPWKSEDPVHARTEGRFAKHPDGKITKPQSKAG